MNPDGTPHPSNTRAPIIDYPDFWAGFEQEYFLYQDGRPLGFPEEGYPLVPQGPYYCGVGYKYMGGIAREIVEEHLELCLAAGINHEGINAEVAKGQWEFQIFGKGQRATCSFASAKSMRSMSSSIASPSRATGTAPACTVISPPALFARPAARSTLRR